MTIEPKILSPGNGQIINVLGDNQTVRLTGEDTGGQFALVEQSNPPGVGVPRHFHQNEDELFHVVEGQIEFKVAGQSVVASAGTTVFLPRNIPHEFMVVGDSPAKSLVMVFPAGMEKMFYELSELPSGPPDMGRVVEICGRYGVIFVPPEEQATK